MSESGNKGEAALQAVNTVAQTGKNDSGAVKDVTGIAKDVSGTLKKGVEGVVDVTTNLSAGLASVLGADGNNQASQEQSAPPQNITINVSKEVESIGGHLKESGVTTPIPEEPSNIKSPNVNMMNSLSASKNEGKER